MGEGYVFGVHLCEYIITAIDVKYKLSLTFESLLVHMSVLVMQEY